MSKAKSGAIKQILKNHFDGFWRMHSDPFHASYREDIKETIEKVDRKKLNELSKKVAVVFNFYYQCKSKKRQLRVDVVKLEPKP